MKFIVKLFPEIMMKSKPVRKRFSKMLQGNIRNVLTRHDEDIKVILEWDKLLFVVRMMILLTKRP